MKLRLIGSAALLALTLMAVPAFKGKEIADSMTSPSVATPEFTRYWSQGKAEISRYLLDQARYGEIRRGDAVLIFVTEDFLSQKQVKLESAPDGRPWVPTLKLNFSKKFTTGIYPYSMMTSVFSPIEVGDFPHALKVSSSAQEWCGQTFTQLNLREKKYEVETRSYFEREGDEDFSLDDAYLEDEIWTRIRLAPQTLPTGPIKMIPGTMAARLRHKRLRVEDAAGSFESIPATAAEPAKSRYTITYGIADAEGHADRTLSILFRADFPHDIYGWTETYIDGFGPNAKRLSTTARRSHTIMSDYWNHNGNADSMMRRELGLP